MKNARQIKIIALNSLADAVSQIDLEKIPVESTGMELDEEARGEVIRIMKERHDKFLDALEGTVDRNTRRLEARMKRRQAREQQQQGIRQAREEKLKAKEQRKKDREEARKAKAQEREEARNKNRTTRRGSNQFELKPAKEEKSAEGRRRREPAHA